MSDTHIGMSNVNAKILLSFLKSIKSEEIILNGDIIDFDALERGSKWGKTNTSIIKRILKISSKTKITYIRGNHDDVIKQFFGFKIKNIEICERKIIVVGDRKFLVLHGDIFDSEIFKNKFTYQIGSIAYDFALYANSIINDVRKKMGLPYIPISKFLKAKVKGLLSFISDFEKKAIEEAIKNNCDGVICGHIHTPSYKIIENIVYMNSGDWVENFTAIGIKQDGTCEIIHYPVQH